MPAPTITFLGGAGTVTGSKFLVRSAEGSSVLVDCGLFQGRKELRLRNWASFEPAPGSIDAIVLTHAHVDHCGAVPLAVRDGFAGAVHCTDGTARLAEIVLPDSGHLHEEEAAFANRMGYSKHRPALPLYTKADAERSLGQLAVQPFDQAIEVAPGVEVTWHHAGHILGAAWVEVHLVASGHRIVFSGDLGRPDHPLLLPPAPIVEADVIVCESTYGDQRRPSETASSDGVRAVLAEAVTDAARRGGVVLIPAFAVDRTEMVLHHLERLLDAGEIPDVPVFVDSPMASAALDVYRAAALAGSPEIRPELHGRELFDRIQLVETRSVEESKELTSRHGPIVVISASGMATGGRILHHLAARLGDDRNSIVLVGFQAPGTRGERLANGARTLKLLGAEREIEARVRALPLSAHADQAELTSWLTSPAGHVDAVHRPRHVYLVHGEPAASSALADHLAATWPVPIDVAAMGDQVELSG